MLCLLHRAVDEPDDRKPGQPPLDVCLHLDAPWIESDERVRHRACDHSPTIAVDP
jgi:hypothetical protein